MLTGNYKGSYKEFEDKLLNKAKEQEVSFDEAAAIADKILARKVKKNGNR